MKVSNNKLQKFKSCELNPKQQTSVKGGFFFMTFERGQDGGVDLVTRSIFGREELNRVCIQTPDLSIF